MSAIEKLEEWLQRRYTEYAVSYDPSLAIFILTKEYRVILAKLTELKNEGSKPDERVDERA